MGVPTYPTNDWEDDLYEQTTVADTTLQNMENMFATLKNSYAGNSAPANSKAGQVWFDNDNKLLKLHRQDVEDWQGIMHGSSATPIWMYVNTAPEGWVLGPSVTDRVLALKGGSYGATGGVQVGAWQQDGSDLSIANLPAHTHTGTTDNDGAHTHSVVTYSAEDQGPTKVPRTSRADNPTNISGAAISSGSEHTHDFTSDSVGSGTEHDHGDTYRPWAAVGILVVPNV